MHSSMDRRDVQAGSILLDDKFEVYLGSLSNACAREGDPHRNEITPKATDLCTRPCRILTINLCARLLFWEVFLELVTGKLGLSNSEDSTMREWLDHTLSRISSGNKEFVMKIMDPSLIRK
ncbi:hypothetical protein MLD38_022255 [Melastoma candidum]|uniref:Uncharacterized protein n=1 Tax=Melastoma candidum TaxID=119954 RepID=A0ACB9QRT7_9MYRT|nr:hypothetical protein MLD38_022255 [Melastoma candidum]